MREMLEQGDGAAMIDGHVPWTITIDAAQTAGNLHTIWWHEPVFGLEVSESYFIRGDEISVQTVWPMKFPVQLMPDSPLGDRPALHDSPVR